MLELFTNAFKFFKNIYFLTNVSFIIIFEMCKYYCGFGGTYENFIFNLASKLSKNNIIYVKIFQSCALNNNLIDNNINHKLINFTNNAPWTEEEDVDLETLNNLEKEYDIRIENDYKPINSGMISLVYKGTDIITEDTVIIKIKRKNIEEKLDEGLEKLLFFLQIVDSIPFINTYGLPEVVQKNISLISHQTNFHTEVENIQYFKKVCENLKYIIIPEVYPKATSQYPNIILMEYINGNTIYNVNRADYEIFAKRFMQFFFITMFMHGRVHGDLHVGNILFIEDKAEKDEKYKHKLGILDFGIIYEISETRNALFDIYSELCVIPPKETAYKVLYSGLLEPVSIIKNLSEEHSQHLIGIIEVLVNETVNIDKKINQINVCKFSNNLNAYISQHKIKDLNLKLSGDLLKLQVMFGMFHGVLLTLCDNNKEYMDFYNKVIRETFQLDLFEDDDDDDDDEADTTNLAKFHA